MRVLNQQILDDTLTGSAEVFSAPTTFDLLGGVEKLVLHVRAARASSSQPTLTVKLYHSNDGQDWQTKTTFSTIALSTTAETAGMLTDPGTTPSGAFVRVGAAMTNSPASSDTVDVKITACGRAEQAR